MPRAGTRQSEDTIIRKAHMPRPSSSRLMCVRVRGRARLGANPAYGNRGARCIPPRPATSSDKRSIEIVKRAACRQQGAQGGRGASSSHTTRIRGGKVGDAHLHDPKYPHSTLGPRPAAALRGLTVRLGVPQEYCSCHLWRPPTEIITSDSLAGKLRVWAVMTDGHAASFLGPDESTGALQRANRECV